MFIKKVDISGVMMSDLIPGPVWESYFDNTKWVPTYGFLGDYWDGSGWQSGDYSGGYYMHLTAIGTWANSYRPTHVRITFTVAANSLRMRDTNGNDVRPTLDPTSGQQYTMAWTEPYNLTSLEMSDLSHTAPGFKLTNIEFLPT